MKLKYSSLPIILLLLLEVINGQSNSTQSFVPININQGKNIPHPSQFIKAFPAVKWGMDFKDTKELIKKSGANPVSIIKTEIAWDNKFGNTFGRATVLLDEKSEGVNQISLVLYGMEKLENLYTEWREKLIKKYGKISEKSDNSFSTSLVWRLKEKFAVELRKIKDPGSSVINLNWVKE